MKKTGAWLVRYALEQLGIRHTFGIPGVHNTEIYDELNNSEYIEPILVTHEGGASFMADAVSRTNDHVGCLLIVPAAGVTHAASGIAEAHLDGIPMLIISGGVRTDTGNAYQLHDMDQHGVLAPITKATFKIEHQKDIVETFYKAYDIATQGEPGPVFIEVPVNVQLFTENVPEPKAYAPSNKAPMIDEVLLDRTARALLGAKNVGMFVGWGAKECTQELIEIAEILGAPVSTTLQGLSVFPSAHPLHTGMGFGPSAVPAAKNAFSNIDCLFAIGTRFSEIPTGSFGIEVPENLIHLDINPDVFNANYPAKTTLEGDAATLLPALLRELKKICAPVDVKKSLTKAIAIDKQDYLEEWLKHDSKNRVNPATFFQTLHQHIKDEDYVMCDDGNHTFLCAEQLDINQSKHFVSPTDFNCMGYAVPATVACQLTHPDSQTIGIVGDGAFLMTAMELLTATKYGLSPIVFVFNDGELSQISQAQEIPYNRKTCSILAPVDIAGVAQAVGAEYVQINETSDLASTMKTAFESTGKGKPVLVNVLVDYSKRTQFTQGTVKTNLKRFDFKTKVRFIGRAISRKVTG